MKIAKKIKLNGPVISSRSQWIYDWLGWDAISPGRLQQELDAANGEDVELHINSPGGNVFDGSEIYTMLKEYAGNVTAKITGVAASAASFFMLGAKKIMISPTAQIMIHKALTGTYGNSDTHNRSTKMLDSTDKAITNAYILKTKKSQEELLALMGEETWMNAQKAVELGFADEIMYDSENIISPINSINSMEIPEELIAKLTEKLLANPDAEKASVFSELFGFDSVKNQLPLTNTTNERNDKPMNLEELKAQHPDLYNQVFNLGKEDGKAEGVKNERARITALNDLAKSPGASAIVAEAINNGDDVGATAIKIVQASAQHVQNVAANRQADAQDSGANNVPGAAAPQNEGNQDTEATNLLLNAAKTFTGGN